MAVISGASVGMPATAGDWSACPVPGSAGVARRIESIVINPSAASWRGIPDVATPTGCLLFGPPDPYRHRYVQWIAARLQVAVIPVDWTRTGFGVPDLPAVFDLGSLDDLHPLESAARLAGLFDAVLTRPIDRRPIIVATTDAPWMVDSSLFAPERFARTVFVPPPDWSGRRWRLEQGAATRRIDIGHRIEELTIATTGWTGTDLDRLLDWVRGEVVGAPSGSLLLDGLARVQPSLTAWMQSARSLLLQPRQDDRFDDLWATLERADGVTAGDVGSVDQRQESPIR